MDRRIELYAGPFDGRTARIFRRDGQWPTRMGLFDDRRIAMAVYARRSNRRWEFAGYEPVPPEEAVVRVDVVDGQFVLSDPTGTNDYSDLPSPPPGHPDPLGFVTDLFEGGRTHMVAGEGLRG